MAKQWQENLPMVLSLLEPAVYFSGQLGRSSGH